MSRTKQTARLLAGALLATASTAPASADFIIVDTTHNNGLTDGPYAYCYTLIPSFIEDFEIGAAVGPTTASASIAGANQVDVILSADEISGAMTEGDTESFGYFEFMTNFGVDTDTDVTLSWDLDPGIDPGEREFFLRDATNSVILFDYDDATHGDSGSVMLSLTQGVQYYVETELRAFEQTSTGSFRIAGPVCPSADINGDGVVDTADLGILIGQFGQGCK